jgi:hypothetical protein
LPTADNTAKWYIADGAFDIVAQQTATFASYIYQNKSKHQSISPGIHRYKLEPAKPDQEQLFLSALVDNIYNPNSNSRT